MELREVEAKVARSQLFDLLREVGGGEIIDIFQDGKFVARLSPPPPKTIDEAIARREMEDERYLLKRARLVQEEQPEGHLETLQILRPWTYGMPDV